MIRARSRAEIMCNYGGNFPYLLGSMEIVDNNWHDSIESSSEKNIDTKMDCDPESPIDNFSKQIDATLTYKNATSWSDSFASTSSSTAIIDQNVNPSRDLFNSTARIARMNDQKLVSTALNVNASISRENSDKVAESNDFEMNTSFEIEENNSLEAPAFDAISMVSVRSIAPHLRERFNRRKMGRST